MQSNAKSSAVAGVLGVFLGAFGGHDWYLGNTKKAITHVCLCVGGLIFLIVGVILTNLSRDIPVFNMLFVCLIIAAYVILVGNGIWGFIEGVIILMQGDAGLAAKGYQVATPQPMGGTNMIQQGENMGTPGVPVEKPAENAGVEANMTPVSMSDVNPVTTVPKAPELNAAGPVVAQAGVAEAPKMAETKPVESAAAEVTDKPEVKPVDPVAGAPADTNTVPPTPSA